MQTEKPFSEHDSLKLIESMINKARNEFHENGHLYLVWGWVVLICSLAQFILMRVVHYAEYYQVWFVTWLAVAYQLYYLAKRKKKRKVRTYTDGILANVWLAFGVSMLLTGFVSGMSQTAGAISDNPTPALFLVLYGIPTYLSGIILRFIPLKAGGIACWFLAIAGTFIPSDYRILLLGLAVIAAWIIPGYLLRRRYDQKQVQ